MFRISLTHSSLQAFFLALAFSSSCALVSSIASASSVDSAAEPESSELSLEAAEAVVAEYRELRRQCAQKSGHEKMRCFHELSANNSEYRFAKQQLQLSDNSDQNPLHLVSF